MRRDVYRPDMSLIGKVRRRVTRLYCRREASANPGRAMVSFAFDDMLVSAARGGAAILEDRDVRGTCFIAGALAGRVGHMGPYASREDVCRLAEAGHEIACHTFSHFDCGHGPMAAISAELDRSARRFAEWGLPAATTFAYPYGDVGFAAKRAVHTRFALARALHPGLLVRGSDLNQAPAIAVAGERGEARALHWLARAHARRGWVILFTHGVESHASTWGTSEASWARLVDHALERNFDVVTVAEGAARIGARGVGQSSTVRASPGMSLATMLPWR